MTAWWTDMSTTGNIIRVRPPLLLRLRRPRWLRPRRGAVSAVDAIPSQHGFDGTLLIGEQVRRLRDTCTGHAPVHVFLKAATALVLAAAPLSSAHAAAAAAPAQAAQSPASQNVEDFYRARRSAPLWLAPAAGDAAEQLISLLGTSSLDGLDPDKYDL